MERGDRYGHPRCGRAEANRCGCIEVALNNPVVEILDEGIIRGGQHHRQASRLDAHRDARVVRGHDLGTVAKEDLVAIVRRRVVARRDHHTGCRTEIGDTPRQNRCGDPGGEQEGPHTPCRQHPCGVVSELLAPVTGVETDDDATRRGAGVLPKQVVGNTGGGAANHQAVHTVRPCAEGAAQTGGAELQRRRETIIQRRSVIGEEQQTGLVDGDRVGVVSHPRLHLLTQ